MTAKTLALGLFLAILFATFSYGQDVTWSRFTSDAGGYNVLFPMAPTLTEQDAASPEGTKFKQYLAQSLLRSQMFAVAYFDVVPGWTYSLEKGRDGIVKAVGGTLISDELISLGGKPGRKFRIGVKNQTFNAVGLGRLYEIDGRVYMLQSLFVETPDEAPYLIRANKFFDSFAVKGK